MAALFRDFSFDAPSPSLADHEAERALMNCSPTSLPTTPQRAHARPLTPPPCTMGDLAQLLGGQKLFISTARSHHVPAGPPTPPSDDDAFPHTFPDASHSASPNAFPDASHNASPNTSPNTSPDTFRAAHPDPRAPRPTYCRASASILRMQRQAHSRLQCCASQARDMARLVRMVQQEEQCRVSAAAPRAASTSATADAGDDEGIDMDHDCSLRVTEPLFSRPPHRAGERHGDSVRVSKHVRMRKRPSTARDTKERRQTK